MSTRVLTPKKSGFFREANAVITIAARDIRLAFKSPAQLGMAVVMPLIMMGMLGGSLAQNMAGALDFDYGQFMLVGMLVNMVFMFTVMGMASLVDDEVTDFTQEMLISPISRYSIVIGKIFGSSFGAVVSLAGTLGVGLAMGFTLHPGQWLLILALSPLLCLSAGALAMLIIGLIKNQKTANIAVMLVTMPQMFLSGAIIPIAHSSGILLLLNRLMPMTYCLDLVRAVVYAGTPEYDSVVLFNPLVNCLAIVTLTIVCLLIGTFFFARTEKNR
jgi:ABC-2 type transport system permease protein